MNKNLFDTLSKVIEASQAVKSSEFIKIKYTENECIIQAGKIYVYFSCVV